VGSCLAAEGHVSLVRIAEMLRPGGILRLCWTRLAIEHAEYSEDRSFARYTCVRRGEVV
jgi:hypothetical protein